MSKRTELAMDRDTVLQWISTIDKMIRDNDQVIQDLKQQIMEVES